MKKPALAGFFLRGFGADYRYNGWDMRRIILLVLLILIGVPALLAGAGWYLLGNQAFLKGVLHRVAMSQTGRALEVGGDLKLELGAVTTIDAADVRFSNPDWMDEPFLGTVGHVKVAFELRSLFSKPLLVEELEVADCRVSLVETASGEANWKLFPEAADTPLDDSGDPSSAIRLGRVMLDNCDISLDQPDRKHPLEIQVTELDSRLLDDGQSRAHATGLVNQVPLSFKGTVGPIRNLWQGGPFEEQVEFNLGKISFASSGTLADARDGSGANISIRFSGPEFEEITDYLAWPPFSTDAFDFTLELKSDGPMTDLKLDGDLGSFDISSSGELDRLLKPDHGQLSLTATGPDLEALGELFEIEGLAHGAFSIQVESSIDHGQISLEPAVLEMEHDRVEARGRLGQLPELKGSDLSVKVHSGRLDRWAKLVSERVASLQTVDSSGRLFVDDGGNLGIQAQATHLGSRLEVKGDLGPVRKPNQPSLDFDLDSADVSQIAGLIHIGQLTSAPVQATGHYRLDSSGHHFEGIDLKLGDNSAVFSGLLSSRPKREGSEFKGQVDIPSTAAFGVLFGYTGWPDEPLKLAATLIPSGSGLVFKLRDGGQGDFRLELDGSIKDLRTPSDFDVKMDVKLPSLTLLNFLADDVPLPDLPFEARGEVAHLEDSYRFNQLHLEWGQSVADIDGEITSGQGHTGSSVSFSASGPDYAEWLQLPVLDGIGTQFTVSGQWSRSPDGDQLDTVVARLGDVTVHVDGQVDQLFGPENLSLQLKADIPDPTRFSPWLEPTAAPKPLSVEMNLEGSLQNLSLKNVSLNQGASKLKGEMNVQMGESGKWSGSMQAELLDLTDWVEAYKQRKAAEKKAPKSRAGETAMMFPDTPVLSFWDVDMDLDLDIVLDQVDLGNTLVEEVHVGILLSDHELQLDPLEARDQQGSAIAGTVHLDATRDVPELAADLRGSQLRVGLAALEEQDPSSYPPIDVNLNLHGAGKTWREVASSLNGNMQFFAGSGQVAEAGLHFFYSDFIVELFNALNPVSKSSKYTQLDCGVVAAEIVSGQAEVNPILFQTREVTVVSQGVINLKTEQINLTFNTKARKGIGLSPGALINPFIKVGGTLEHPALQLDPASAVISSGAAVATVGISVLAKSFSDRFLSSHDPCGDARKKLAEAGKQARK